MSEQQIVLSGGENAAQVATWDPESGAALPAYLSDALGELGTNIPDRQTVPSLSYEGKMWTIVKDGNKTKLQVQNADGDSVPVPIMRVVVLNFNADRGRSYYPGVYNPAASAAPTCWSADGKAPDASVTDKQSALCASCPLSVKGSKVMEGREMVACSSHRMIAILPGMELTHDPLRLKIAVTSDYDKETVEHGWFAFRQYVDYLKARGMPHTALVITKIKFDPNPAYPKLLFALDRPLTQAEVATVKEALKNPKVAELLAEKWTAAGSAGTLVDNSDIAPQPALQETVPLAKPAPQSPAHYHEKGTDAELWWDEDTSAWVKPWVATTVTAAAPPPPPAPYVPRDAALADGWVQHPDSPPHGYKGADVLDWAAIDAKYPGPGNVAAVAPAAPVTAPVVVATVPSGLPAALADGWAPHPSAPGYHWKGTEVKTDAETAALYPGNGASGGTPAASAGLATSAEATPGAGTSTTATATASPSDTEVTPELKSLLDKWTTG